LAETEPWKLVKTDPERVQTIMNIALQITANLSIVLQPFLPDTASKLASFLSIDPSSWETAGSAEILSAGHLTQAPSILFQKIEDTLVELEVAKLKATNMSESSSAPQKDETSFDDFMKMDIRLGKILSAEKVEKADKLLQLTVDTGIDKRTIISGIAEHYTPEEVVGKTVSVLVNLAPRKIRGVESQGMILMAEDVDGKLCFVVPEKDFKAGSNIR
jgi:methionyl-tRNA synthetase